jgi:flavin reductase (DIM6/NTAB) family NADH-FMN oxidoreductase RutF
MTSDFDNTALKKAFGSFATGVAVATSHSSGFTINSFSSLSLSPPLIIFNIYKTETDHVDFLKNNSFVINFLSREQEDVSRLFATKDLEKVNKTQHSISENKNIILNDTLGHIELSVFQQIDIADHVLVIGEVQNLETDDNKKPLIYYRSKYQSLKDE